MDRLTNLLPAWVSTTTTAILVLTTGTIATLIGTKNLPLGYTLRLLPSLYRLLRPRHSSSSKNQAKPNNPSSTSPVSSTASIQNGTLPVSAHSSRLFTYHVTRTRAYLPEIDINVHKSNSTFFVDADISRAALLTSLLADGLANLPSTSSSPAKGRPKVAMFLLAGVACKFLRPIAPLEGYEVSSRILAWEEGPNTKGAMYVVTYFLRLGIAKKLGARDAKKVELHGGPAALMQDEKLRKGVFAVMVSRYVFKRGRESISPEVVFRAAGLIQDGSENGASAAAAGKGQGDWMDEETVRQAVKSGLEYVAGCML